MIFFFRKSIFKGGALVLFGYRGTTMKKHLIYSFTVLILALIAGVLNNLRLDNYSQLDWFSSPEVWEKPQ